jgi:hypothetical protein
MSGSLNEVMPRAERRSDFMQSNKSTRRKHCARLSGCLINYQMSMEEPKVCLNS